MSRWSGDPPPSEFPKAQTTLPSQAEEAEVHGHPKGFRILSSEFPQTIAALALQQQAASILASPEPKPKAVSYSTFPSRQIKQGLGKW